MLLHCDLVYAAETATFQLPFVNLGLVPEAGSSLLLPRLVGYHRAAELMLLGERFDVGVAREIGLVNAVCPAAELDTLVRARAAALAAKPPAALRLTKALLKGDAAAVSARIAEESEHFRRQLRSPEAREAMAAFMEKRKPDFSRFA
jgi:enoyl-CoA hydratase/carnithine racemase